MNIQLHDANYVPFYKRVSYLYIPAFFVLITILMEIVMFVVMGLKFPSVYIFSLSIVLSIATITAVIRNKWIQTVICSVFLGWQLFTTISNIIAFQTCNEIFSLETFKTLTTAFDNAGAVEVNLWFLIPIILLVLVYIVAVVLTILFCNRPKEYHSFKWQKFLCGVLAFISFTGYTVAYSGLPNYSSNYVPNLTNRKFIYDTFSNRVGYLQTFGSYSFYLDNLLALIGGKSSPVEFMDLNVKEEFVANQDTLSADEVLGEGYNLITVLMETFERQAINPITTPTLHQFMQESCLEVNGYYSIERTCVTDHISQTGMHPDGKEYWNNYADVTAPHYLPKIFNRSNYVTQAFHNTDGTCYDRNGFFEKSIGFSKFNNFYTYENPHYTEQHAFNSDELLFKSNLEQIAPADQNFYSYIISVSTHSLSGQKYSLEQYFPDEFELIEQKWTELVQLYPVLASDDEVKVQTALNYLAGTISFDKGFERLLHYLKDTDDKLHAGKKLIETTALVMFGDHYYYANPQSVLGFETSNARTLAGNRCPLIVYNPRQVVDGVTQAENAVKSQPDNHGVTLNRFTSTMDIYPTICSLFGIQTDQQLTYGRSIFGSDESIGVTYLSGYIFGADGYNPDENRVDNINGEVHINWNLWRTLDFRNYHGTTLSSAQVKAIAPTVNRVYDSILINTKLYNQDGFNQLQKANYTLGKSNLI